MRPILFELGPLTIHSWGAVVAVGFAIALYLMYRDAKRVSIDPAKILDFGLLTLILALIGARLMYVLFDLGQFIKNPVEILMLQNGGLSIHGGLLGGLIAGVIFTRRNNISFFKLADLTAAPLILGQAIGRIGCLLAGICYGKITELPWAIKFEGIPGLRHPTQLYESGLDFMIFAVLWAYRKKIRFEGQLFLIYVITYSIARSVVESFRDDMQLIGPITFAQLASIFIVIIAAAIYGIKAKKNGASAAVKPKLVKS